MWSEKEKYKNHFLQMQLKHLKPQKINEMVEKEITKTQTSRGYCNMISPTKSACKSALYFEDRTDIAYGSWALPKLLKELASNDYLTQWKVINSLSEYLANPIFAQKAITEYDIVRRCQNVFLRIRMKYRKVKYRETICLLKIFYYIAFHRCGAQKIAERYRLLDQFYIILRDRKEHLEAISKILPFLSEHKDISLQLIHDYNVFDKLFNIWNKDPCISYYPNDLWLHLTQLLQLAPEEAVKRGFFEILYKRISGRLLRYNVWDMKCFGLLLHCAEGQKRFLQIDGVKFLYTILDEQFLDNYENVIFCLMQSLFCKAVLWRSREFTKLPLIITELAKDSKKVQQQLYCLQTLRELGVMPIIKRFIKANCFDDIRKLKCETLTNDRQRLQIVYWLEREIYHTSNLKKEK